MLIHSDNINSIVIAIINIGANTGRISTKVVIKKTKVRNQTSGEFFGVCDCRNILIFFPLTEAQMEMGSTRIPDRST